MPDFMRVFACYAHVNALPRKKFSNDFKYLQENGASIEFISVPVIPLAFGDDGVWRSPEKVRKPAAMFISNCYGDFKN